MALVKTVRLNIITDPGTTREKLDAISAKADELGKKNPEIKVKIDTAAAALKLQVLKHELKDTGTQTEGLGARLSGLLPVLGRLGAAGGAGGGLLALGSSAVALAGPLGAATIALGAFGAVAVPVLTKVEAAQKKLTAAQQAYAKAGTPAGRASALKAEQAATQGLSGSQIQMMHTLQELKGVFSGVGKAMSPFIEALLKMVVTTSKDLVPSLTRFAQAGGTIIMEFLGPFNKLLQSSLFARFADQITKFAVQAGAIVGPQLVKLLAAFMRLFIDVMPSGIKILGALLPALVQIVSDLTPVITAVAKITAVTLTWLSNNHLLVGAIGAVAVAIGILMGASGIGAVTLLITGLILVGEELYRHWGTIWGFIKRIVVDVWTWIKDHWPLLLIILTGPIGIAVVYITRHWHAIMDGVRAVIDWVKAHWPLLLDILTGPVGIAVTYIIRHWTAISDGVSAVLTWIRDHWPLLVDILTGPIGAAVLFIVRHWTAIKDGAKAVWDWISSSWNRIGGWLEEPFRAAEKVIGGIFRTISGWIHAITGFFSGGGGSSTSGGGGGGRFSGGGAGSAQSIAAGMLGSYGWGQSQMGPLDALWTQESGWRWNAQNPTSGAYGIPQALPADKMASAGPDWRTNPATQIRWGLGYIKGRYGSPAAAEGHEQAFNWYGNGLTDGLFTRPTLIGVGERGPERVSVTPAARGGGSGGNTYNITVNVGPTAHKREVGREVVAAIVEYEKGAGNNWRS